MPATSFKGAIAHRVAFHYNKLKGCYIDNGLATEGNNNEAVKQLFGYIDAQGANHRGKILFSDLFVESQNACSEKVIPHVAIDRFTGGALDGALFSEKTVYGPDAHMELHILCPVVEDECINRSLQLALEDICKGLLPLGGGVNRGNGTFVGNLKKNSETVYENQ